MRIEFLGIYLGDCESIDSACEQWEGWHDFYNFVPSNEFLKIYSDFPDKQCYCLSIHINRDIDSFVKEEIKIYFAFNAKFYNGDDFYKEFDIKKFIGVNK